MKSLQLFWTQYADFSRRSDRKEFWISQAWHLLFTSPFWIYQLVLLFSNSKSEEEVIPLTGMAVSAWFSIFFLLYLYLIFVPQQAVVVRRLRDAGFHWSLIFLFLGPILLYLLSPLSLIRKKLTQPHQGEEQPVAEVNQGLAAGRAQGWLDVLETPGQ